MKARHLKQIIKNIPDEQEVFFTAGNLMFYSLPQMKITHEFSGAVYKEGVDEYIPSKNVIREDPVTELVLS